MNQNQQPGPGAAHLIGLLLVAFGAVLMAATFDIGPLGTADINGPPWLGVACGGVFAAAGLALIAGPPSPLVARLFGILVLAGLAALGNWVAFGVGERVCGGGISLPWLSASSDFSGLSCRLPFGFGALVANAVLFLMIVSTLQQALGGPPRLERLLKAAEWLMFASLAPLLLPMILILVLVSAIGVIKTRLTSGAWPRNEEFIARQKRKGLLARFGNKPPAGGGGDSV